MHPLAERYRQERAELIALGRTLTEAEAAVKTTACPDWSIKDIYAHLGGISSDILSGNTEGAATEPWADAQVAARLDFPLSQVLDEWERDGASVSEIMASDGAEQLFPFQLFIDQWTHGWDIRAAIGEEAAATPDLAVMNFCWSGLMANMAGRQPAGTAAVSLKISGLADTGSTTFDLGTGERIGELRLNLFEYGRIAMGRRSREQLDALGWPDAVEDPSPYIDLLVVWSVNDQAVIDPVA